MSKNHCSANMMAQSHLEPDEETSTLNHLKPQRIANGDEPLKEESSSPVAHSALNDRLESTMANSINGNASSDATPPVSSSASNSPVGRALGSPINPRSSASNTTRTRQSARVNKDTHSAASPRVKESVFKSPRVAKRKSPTQSGHGVKPGLHRSPSSTSLIPSTQHGTLDGTIDDDANESNKHQLLKQPKKRTRKRQGSDTGNNGTGEVELEIEQGATNLWSILQKADADNTDDEQCDETETKPSFKGSRAPSSKSAQTVTKSPKKARTDFFSTVLNDSPSKTAVSLLTDDSPSNTKKSTAIKPSAKHKSTRPFTPATSPPFDPNATSTSDDDDAPNTTITITTSSSSITPRRRSTFLNPPAPQTTATISIKRPTTPPTRICKTTGKPFDHSMTVRATPRKRAPPLAEFVSDQIPIPTSWDVVSDADKMLMHMKEEGKSWDAIRKMWKERTGQDAAPSTLPNRYNRIKANLMRLGEGEHAILLASVLEVDKVQKAEKWGRVATVMHNRGAGKYPGEYLQKQFSALN